MLSYGHEKKAPELKLAEASREGMPFPPNSQRFLKALIFKIT